MSAEKTVTVSVEQLRRWSIAMETAEEWMQHTHGPGTEAYRDVVEADKELRALLPDDEE